MTATTSCTGHAKADTQSSADINRKRKDGRTPLMMAVIKRQRAVSNLLMQNGVNVAHGDDYGNNVLYFTCRSGQLDLVKYFLFESTVDINRNGKDGRTPLMMAVIKRQRTVSNLLMQNGANVAHGDDYGNNVLHFTCRGGQLDLVKYFLFEMEKMEGHL
ncbi:putative ankyrin repeat protein RBE_0220 [Haliotis asinina]|uniref:putative ankyrin repeat protein RBE_0220 n=1 Tax=Haliotis asinina TaxID=109174 RepID=UPI00353207E6